MIIFYSSLPVHTPVTTAVHYLNQLPGDRPPLNPKFTHTSLHDSLIKLGFEYGFDYQLRAEAPRH